jgi:hypothetical protein
MMVAEPATQQDEQHDYDQDNGERVHVRFRFALAILRFTASVTLPTGSTIVSGFGGSAGGGTNGVTTIIAGVSSPYPARNL